MPADLLVVLPTRSRPANVARCAEAFRATAKNADMLVITDHDDRSYDGLDFGVSRRTQPRKPTAAKVNAAVMDHLGYRAIMFMGDDNVCVTPGWDEIMLAALDDMGGTGICYPNDLSGHAELPCSAMLSSNIVRALGWMCLPAVAHFFCDNAWQQIGLGTGSLRRCEDAVIDHLHPIWGKAPADALYSDTMRLYWRHDKAAYAMWQREQMAADVAKVAALR